MTMRNKKATLIYTDDDGCSFELSIIKHFTFGDQRFVLAVENHHHEDCSCSCHGHHHSHENFDATEAKPLYVFEWIDGSEGGQLVSINDETLQALAPILEAM